MVKKVVLGAKEISFLLRREEGRHPENLALSVRKIDSRIVRSRR
jgi:hypothetical protein